MMMGVKMKSKVTLLDLKQALWDKRFQELFPEYKEQIVQFMKDPGCGCNHAFLRTLMRNKDRIQSYFPTKQVVTPEEEAEEVKTMPNSWKVINCNVHNLAEKLKDLPKGRRMIAASRFRDKVTVVTNDVESMLTLPPENVEDVVKNSREAEMNWKVINTTIFELENELASVAGGRKILQITRYKEQVTAIINDMTTLF